MDGGKGKPHPRGSWLVPPQDACLTPSTPSFVLESLESSGPLGQHLAEFGVGSGAGPAGLPTSLELCCMLASPPESHGKIALSRFKPVILRVPGLTTAPPPSSPSHHFSGRQKVLAHGTARSGATNRLMSNPSGNHPTPKLRPDAVVWHDRHSHRSLPPLTLVDVDDRGHGQRADWEC